MQEREGVEPDLTAMHKAVANGHPVSLLCWKGGYTRQFDPWKRGRNVHFSGTYDAHTAGMAAAVETLRRLEERGVHGRFEGVDTG